MSIKPLRSRSLPDRRPATVDPTGTRSRTAPGSRGVALDAERALASRLAANALSPATRRAYAADARVFDAWCHRRGLTALPASPDTVVRFLAAEAAAGRRASTATRRLAAIRYAHQTHGLPSPVGDARVLATLRGLRRTIGSAPHRKAPATADIVARLVAAIPDTLTGARDRALIWLGFAGAFRRSELSAIAVNDLAFMPHGLMIHLRRSKTDPLAVGQRVALPAQGASDAIAAVGAWIARAAISEGPLFRSISRQGVIRASALTPHGVNWLIKACASRAGLDPRQFSGQSLRAGFLTTGAAKGASVFDLMAVSRHRCPNSLLAYVRLRDDFDRYPGIAPPTSPPI